MTILLCSVLGNDSAGILPVVWRTSLQMEKVKRRAPHMTSDLENMTSEERLNELGSQAKGKEV